MDHGPSKDNVISGRMVIIPATSEAPKALPTPTFPPKDYRKEKGREISSGPIACQIHEQRNIICILIVSKIPIIIHKKQFFPSR